jgi:small subunit ribosomal protein S14
LTRKGLVNSNNKKKDSPIQFRNRCRICGRPRGYIRKFGLCRICFRNLAHEGKLPGVVKASW